MIAEVFVRSLNKKVKVKLDNEKPLVPDDIKLKWQNIVNMLAKVLDVPAALIMKITSENMEIFLKSSNPDNPYPKDGKDALLHGLYCETVIGTDDQLLVENALANSVWKDNPDVSLNMISYLGYPIKWEDGSFFGTICVLDSKINTYSELYKELMQRFRDMIETDLSNILLASELKKLSLKDDLTGLGNRRHLFSILKSEYYNFKYNKNVFSVIMMDIDDFKHINDKYGHVLGDDILIEMANILLNNSNYFCVPTRYGGDEFVIVLRNQTAEEALEYTKSIEQLIKENKLLSQYDISISYGIEEMNKKYTNIDELVFHVDSKMYEYKYSRKFDKQ